MSDAKIDLLQIDRGLSELQVIIDEIADGIYMQNAIRSRQLKSQIMNIACVRGQLERIANTLEAQPETAGRPSQPGHLQQIKDSMHIDNALRKMKEQPAEITALEIEIARQTVEGQKPSTNTASDAIALIMHNFREAQTSLDFYNWFNDHIHDFNAVLAQNAITGERKD